MASGHVNRVKRPNTWLHRPMLQNVKKALANPEPSTHGTFRKYRPFRRRSAIRGKAEAARIFDTTQKPPRRVEIRATALGIRSPPPHP